MPVHKAHTQPRLLHGLLDFLCGSMLLASLLGCGNEGGLPSRGTVLDSAGVRVIELPGTGSGGRETPRELPIDSSWAPAEGLETGDLLDMDVVPGRGVLLLDESAGSVLFLPASGEVPAIIGRRGQGPGEFDPQGLSEIVATDSSVFVPDLFLQRLTEFNLAGEVLGILDFPLSPVYAVDWRRHPGGGLVFRAFEPFGDQIVRVLRESVDTLLSIQISNDYGNLLLSPVTLWDLTADGQVLFGRTDRASVEARRQGTGELIWRARWNHDGETLDQAALAHLEELVRERILRDAPNISGELLAQNLASIQYPERGPVFAGLMAAPGGDVWVRRAKPVQAMDTEALRVGSAEAFGGRVWDVLDRDGFLKASLALPERFTPKRFVGQWICGILADERGIETVARVHITGS